MAVYRFKVKFEDYDDVFRVIEVRSTHTFKEFHEAIQQAIGFDNSKSASFYMSDDFWRKGTEITLKDTTTDDDFDPKRKPKRLMNKSKLAEFIEDPHQKMLYLSDFEAQWNFNIELIKIIVDEEVTASYPRCINSGGIAPKQYKPTTAPPVFEDEDDDGPEEHPDKIFHHEEGLDEEDEDEEGKLLEGDSDEEPEEGAPEAEEAGEEL
jgi:hypothetical protein